MHEWQYNANILYVHMLMNCKPNPLKNFYKFINSFILISIVFSEKFSLNFNDKIVKFIIKYSEKL